MRVYKLIKKNKYQSITINFVVEVVLTIFGQISLLYRYEK